MEDLHRDDPNSWLRRTRFSKTVYERPDLTQIPIISISELKFESSNPNSNRATTSVPITCNSTSKTRQSTTMPTLKLNTDNSFTGEVQGFSGSDINKTGTASKHRDIFVILKEVKEAVRRRFVAPPPRETTGAKVEIKSSSRLKKESRWIQRYFDRGMRQVGTPEKSSKPVD